jgi:hypothetical protein
MVVLRYKGKRGSKAVHHRRKIAMRYLTIFKVLEIVLVVEVTLLIFGWVAIFNLHPIEVRLFFHSIIPWCVVITAPFWFVFRKKLRSLETS